jgi:hypothetical protein
MTLVLRIVLLWRAAISCLYVACLLAAAFVPRRDGVTYFRALYETHGDCRSVFCGCNSISPVLVALRSKPWVCGRTLAGIAGSNPTGDVSICFLWMFMLSRRGLCVGLISRPEESCRVLCVFVKPRYWGPGPLGAVVPCGGRERGGTVYTLLEAELLCVIYFFCVMCGWDTRELVVF